ncbi:hypothetical protein Tsubulata_003489 [Turnera subulata]|uniref:RING-type domain-containing protein n=1 Tax=Turnera subulata TaxID=218843 RepID=A0A9Q0G7U4_9ROSI|nr:hypothetical protein Tsubulata_003489 [Turnera subulata]
MDDSCAVCADVLEWVAYGSCGHRDVCSTCVARLRFICEDRRCCICKTESDIVFVTKALGDYTRMINDFSVFPSEPREGRVGSYYFHEDTQSFFDDVDHYRMVKAMCRLSCSECDRKAGEAKDGPNSDQKRNDEANSDQRKNDGAKRKPMKRFRNIEHLKNHLSREHHRVMCNLCLEGRKVFICEQKLYTKAQLNQHIRTGDSEVDGSESERGGFAGHPICEFCRTPFYGDNELYSHMSTEHYTCHICQRQHPGQYEYYKNYDDLEARCLFIHFRREHFLCEDEGCLAKKFIVFQTEAEMKRHNTIEHGGRMSRSKRSAALQIPTSFRYRRGNEDRRRGRGQTFHRDQSDNQLSIAIQASLETAYSERSSHDPPVSSSAQVISDADDSDIDPIVQPFESLTTTDSEASSRYLQALGPSSRGAPLAESLFPPLTLGQSSSQQKSKHDSEGLPSNSMAAHLRRQNNRNTSVVNSSQAWPAAGRGRGSSSSLQYTPAVNTSTSRGSTGPAKPGYASFVQAQAQVRPLAAPIHPSASSSGSSRNTSRISHSSSAPNLSEGVSSKPSFSDFPPVSSAHVRSIPSSSQVLPVVERDQDQSANKSLVEKIRTALGHDEEKYSLFKDISGQYRQGSIDVVQYLDYVEQFGLSHLVLDLARLLPDAQKQKELIESHNASLRSNVSKENGWGQGSAHLRDNNGYRKGKGKLVEGNSSRERLADEIINNVKTLQSQSRPLEEEVEILSKDGYRTAQGKSSAMIDERAEMRNSPSAGDGSNQNIKDGSGVNRQKKKTSKFHRVRLGDGSMAALLDSQTSDPDPVPSLVDDRLDSSNNPVGALPVRGVWRKGGGHKLFP